MGRMTLRVRSTTTPADNSKRGQRDARHYEAGLDGRRLRVSIPAARMASTFDSRKCLASAIAWRSKGFTSCE